MRFINRRAREAASAAILGFGVLFASVAVAQDENGTEDGEIVFRNVLDDAPIEFDERPDQEITPAVETFHETAENPYSGDEEAIADGEELYGSLCAACHLPDGSGRIGPSLIDGESKYPRVETDQGIFEIIYDGGAGAMQAFGQRIDQDEILRIMAYMETLANDSD